MSFAKYPVSGGGSGNVTGPGVSTNNGVVLFNGTSGAVIKDLGVGSANQVLLTNGTTPSFGAITNAYIDSGAAIALSKLAALTASRALVSNGSGVISVSSVTDTELGYVSGVTSAIQTQLNTKANDSAVVHISGTETITGAKTFSSIIASSLTSNQFIAGNVTLSFTNSGTPTTITIPNVAPFATIPLLENAQTFTAQQSFSNNIVVQNRTIVLGTSQLITILGSTPASSRFVTIPEAGADSDFVLTAGSQTIGGSKTLSSAVTINPASNQVILSSGVNQLTLNSGSSAAARTYTIPDTGTTDTFAMLGGAQAFTALKTFNSGLAIAGGAAANNTIWVASNVLRQRGGTSGWAVDNTSGNAILSATDAGLFNFGTVSNSRGLLNRTNTTGLDRVFLNHEIDSVVSYGVGVNSSNAFTIGTTSGLNTWSTQFFNATSTGAVTLGPNSGLNAGHTLQASNSSSESSTVLIYNRVAADSAVFGLRIRKTANDSTTAQRFIGFSINDGATNSGQINANGASSAAFGTFSDRRLKENIENLPNQLNNILALRPVEFDYIAGGHQIGFIAQEMQVVYPDVVIPADSDGMLTITGWDKTSARLVKAIQELAAKNDELEAKLDTLKAS